MNRASQLASLATALLLLAVGWGPSAHAHKGSFNMGAEMNVQAQVQQHMQAQQLLHALKQIMIQQHAAQQHALLQSQMQQHVQAQMNQLNRQQMAASLRSHGQTQQQQIMRVSPSLQTLQRQQVAQSGLGQSGTRSQSGGSMIQMKNMTFSQTTSNLRSSQMLRPRTGQNQSSLTRNSSGNTQGMQSLKSQIPKGSLKSRTQNSQVVKTTQQSKIQNPTTQEDMDDFEGMESQLGKGSAGLVGFQGGNTLQKGQLPKQPVFPGLNSQGLAPLVVNQP